MGLPIVRECRRVFAAAGVALERIPGVPNLPRLERVMRLMNAPIVGPAIALGARRLFNRRPIIFSLQQDLQRGKPTEVDYVNGEIVRLAEFARQLAPANELVVRLVRELEQRGDGTFLAREEVIRPIYPVVGHLSFAATCREMSCGFHAEISRLPDEKSYRGVLAGGERHDLCILSIVWAINRFKK